MILTGGRDGNQGSRVDAIFSISFSFSCSCFYFYFYFFLFLFLYFYLWVLQFSFAREMGRMEKGIIDEMRMCRNLILKRKTSK